MKFYQHIRTKLVFGFLLVALIPVLIIGIYAMQTSIEILHEQELSLQSETIKTFKHNIETFLAFTKKDLIFLSKSYPLQNYLKLQNSSSLKMAREALEKEFLAFAESRNIYYQIRYLDETGQEIVRIDTNNKSNIINNLQNKNDRYYFTETISLPKGKIFISPLDLNREHGQIETPHKPVIRYATPVLYQNGNKAGIVIVNVDANQFLNHLEGVLLIDQKGFYLSNFEDISKCWGGPKDLNTNHNFLTQDYPDLAKQITTNIEGNVKTKDLMLTYHRILVSGIGYWVLIAKQPITKVSPAIKSFKNTFTIIITLTILLSLIIAILISKIITKPIEILTHVTKRISAGNRQIRVKEQGRDEIGILEKGFNAMLDSINIYEEDLDKAKQEAQAANLAKSRFLANMSHELRTPLNAIIGYGEMLQEEIADLGEVEISEDIEKIHLAGKHLLANINDILDISKIEAGKMELYAETFYLSNMVDDIVSTIQPLLNKSEDKLEIYYSDDLGEMYTDLTKIRQVLLKLLSNAAKFSNQQSTIFLEVIREIDDWIVFKVKDCGIGMNVEQKENLFNIFTQADNSTTRKYDGAGLGLAITNHFVKMMGGIISVESELDKGSTFTIRLPAKITLVQRETEENSSAEDMAVLGDGGTILVIDDELEVRKVLHNYLTKQGYQVEMAESGEEGLKLAKKVLPDVIILDVMMPKMDGWEVLSYLKSDKELVSIPVIILSMMEDKTVAYSLGASDYLIKPITREQLFTVLQKYHFSLNESAPLIMVIDDDKVNRDMMERIIRKADFRICKIEDGWLALEYIQKKQKPAVILLDLQMPEMDGFEFIDRLQQYISESIPIIVFTAKDITLEDRIRLKNVALILQKGSYSNE
ncbi:MAG: response regulator, partial [Proteobacteria bacterium]|nr:response regulator [Pseudomonadota bacterium]